MSVEKFPIFKYDYPCLLLLSRINIPDRACNLYFEFDETFYLRYALESWLNELNLEHHDDIIDACVKYRLAEIYSYRPMSPEEQIVKALLSRPDFFPETIELFVDHLGDDKSDLVAHHSAFFSLWEKMNLHQAMWNKLKAYADEYGIRNFRHFKQPQTEDDFIIHSPTKPSSDAFVLEIQKLYERYTAELGFPAIYPVIGDDRPDCERPGVFFYAGRKIHGLMTKAGLIVFEYVISPEDDADLSNVTSIKKRK